LKEIYEINWLDKFKCLGGKCPNTCCKNWIITVDDDCYKAIESRSGFKRTLLKLLVGHRKDGLLYLRKCNETCPFYTKEGLCGHQVRDEMDLMPRICRVFPRRVLEIDDGTNQRTEVTLDLSCIEAARLFLDNLGESYFVKTDNEYESLWYRKNTDPLFVEYLLSFREKLCEDVWSDEDLFSIMRKHFLYAKVCQKRLVSNKNAYYLEDLANIKIEETDSLDWVIPIGILNDIIYNSHSWKDQRKRNPVFYKLLMTYQKVYGRDSEAAFQKKLSAYIISIKHNDKLLKKYRAYYQYCLNEEILDCFEDYYLLGKVIFPILYVYLLMIFDMVSENEAFCSKLLNQKEKSVESTVMSSVERAFRHSDKRKKEILNKIRANLLTDIIASDML